MKTVALTVPEGDKCEGCMFLEINYFFPRPAAKCKLFQKDLSAHWKYGDLDVGSIEKCDLCPREET